MDAQKIVAALSQVSFDGPAGVVKMDRQRHAALTMRLGQVQQDGSIRSCRPSRTSTLAPSVRISSG